MKYITADKNGFVRGFYDASVVSPPENAEPVSDELAQKMLYAINMASKKIKFLDGKIVEYDYTQSKEARIKKSQNYLDGTDWYVSRFIETGKEIPDTIKAERETARERISELRRDHGGDN